MVKNMLDLDLSLLVVVWISAIVGFILGGLRTIGYVIINYKSPNSFNTNTPGHVDDDDSPPLPGFNRGPAPGGPATGGPGPRGPAAGGPGAGQPAIGGPGPRGPGPRGPGPRRIRLRRLDRRRRVTRGSVTIGPVTRDPVTRGPISRGPVTRGPVTRGPISRGPISRSPVTRGPVTRGPRSVKGTIWNREEVLWLSVFLATMSTLRHARHRTTKSSKPRLPTVNSLRRRSTAEADPNSPVGASHQQLSERLEQSAAAHEQLKQFSLELLKENIVLRKMVLEMRTRALPRSLVDKEVQAVYKQSMRPFRKRLLFLAGLATEFEETLSRLLLDCVSRRELAETPGTSPSFLSKLLDKTRSELSNESTMGAVLAHYGVQLPDIAQAQEPEKWTVPPLSGGLEAKLGSRDQPQVELAVDGCTDDEEQDGSDVVSSPDSVLSSTLSCHQEVSGLHGHDQAKFLRSLFKKSRKDTRECLPRNIAKLKKTCSAQKKLRKSKHTFNLDVYEKVHPELPGKISLLNYLCGDSEETSETASYQVGASILPITKELRLLSPSLVGKDFMAEREAAKAETFLRLDSKLPVGHLEGEKCAGSTRGAEEKAGTTQLTGCGALPADCRADKKRVEEMSLDHYRALKDRIVKDLLKYAQKRKLCRGELSPSDKKSDKPPVCATQQESPAPTPDTASYPTKNSETGSLGAREPFGDLARDFSDILDDVSLLDEREMKRRIACLLGVYHACSHRSAKEVAVSSTRRVFSLRPFSNSSKLKATHKFVDKKRVMASYASKPATTKSRLKEKTKRSTARVKPCRRQSKADLLVRSIRGVSPANAMLSCIKEHSADSSVLVRSKIRRLSCDRLQELLQSGNIGRSSKRVSSTRKGLSRRLRQQHNEKEVAGKRPRRQSKPEKKLSKRARTDSLEEEELTDTDDSLQVSSFCGWLSQLDRQRNTPAYSPRTGSASTREGADSPDLDTNPNINMKAKSPAGLPRRDSSDQFSVSLVTHKLIESKQKRPYMESAPPTGVRQMSPLVTDNKRCRSTSEANRWSVSSRSSQSPPNRVCPPSDKSRSGPSSAASCQSVIDLLSRELDDIKAGQESFQRQRPWVVYCCDNLCGSSPPRQQACTRATSSYPETIVSSPASQPTKVHETPNHGRESSPYWPVQESRPSRRALHGSLGQMTPWGDSKQQTAQGRTSCQLVKDQTPGEAEANNPRRGNYSKEAKIRRAEDGSLPAANKKIDDYLEQLVYHRCSSSSWSVENQVSGMTINESDEDSLEDDPPRADDVASNKVSKGNVLSSLAASKGVVVGHVELQ